MSDKAERVRTAAISLDYDQAANYASSFITRFLLQVNTRGLLIQRAAIKFNKFLELPEQSPTRGILEDAWAIVSLAFPILKIASFVNAGKMVLDTVRLTENSVVKMRAAYEKVKAAKETKEELVEPALELLEKARTTKPQPPDGLGELQKLDQSKGPIKELLADAQRMIQIWEAVLQLLPLIKYSRTINPSLTTSPSMLALSRSILTLPSFDSPEAVDEIELQLLYAMIGEWVRNNVTLKTYSTNGNTFVEGLNGTQLSAIVPLFGAGVGRKTGYFNAPIYPSYWAYLRAWKAKAVRVDIQWDGGVTGNKF